MAVRRSVPDDGALGEAGRTRRNGQHVEVLAYDGAEADEHGARDDRVADRHLVQERQLAKDDEIVEIEIVAGVDAKSHAVGEARRLGIDRD